MLTHERSTSNDKILYDALDIKRKLEPIFVANGVKSAMLFGSYAQGHATASSDVDILVDSGLRGLDFVGLIESVREILQKNVDIIDVNYIDRGSPVEREIMATGVRIYG